MSESVQGAFILVARIFLMLLMIIFGWPKLIHFDATIAAMVHFNTPLPTLAAVIAVVVELGFGVLLILGLFTRPLALLTAIYVVGTAFIGHSYWKLTGAAVEGSEINFYKNISIVGGLLLLFVTGGGRYALDYKFGRK